MMMIMIIPTLALYVILIIVIVTAQVVLLIRVIEKRCDRIERMLRGEEVGEYDDEDD